MNESKHYFKYQCVLASQGAGVYIRGTDHIRFAADQPNLIGNVHLQYKIRASFLLGLFTFLKFAKVARQGDRSENVLIQNLGSIARQVLQSNVNIPWPVKLP